MAKWVRSGVLDNGLNDIKTNASKMLLVKAYTSGDSYATVTGNLLGEVSMTSSDYTLASSGNNRTLTTASGKTATASASSVQGDNLHFVFTDGSSSVIWATDETSDQVITSGNTINFPQLVYTSNQPT